MIFQQLSHFRKSFRPTNSSSFQKNCGDFWKLRNGPNGREHESVLGVWEFGSVEAKFSISDPHPHHHQSSISEFNAILNKIGYIVSQFIFGEKECLY